MGIYRSIAGTQQPWTRPNVTSATSHGTITWGSVGTSGTEDGWHAYDGDGSSRYVPKNASSYLKWVLPYNITFHPTSKFVCKGRTDSGEGNNNKIYQFYADAEKTIPLTDLFSRAAKNETKTIDCTLTESVSTDTIYLDTTGTTSWSGFTDINFTGVTTGTPGTIKEVDDIKDSYNRTSEVYVPNSSTGYDKAFENSTPAMPVVTSYPGGVSYNIPKAGTLTENGSLVSGFTAARYLYKDMPSTITDLTIIQRVITDSSFVNKDYACTISWDGSGECLAGLLTTSWTGLIPFLSMPSEGSVLDRVDLRNHKVWVCTRVVASEAATYFIIDDNDTYTLDTLPDITSSTWRCGQRISSDKRSTLAGRRMYFGKAVGRGDGAGSWTIDVAQSKIVLNGVSTVIGTNYNSFIDVYGGQVNNIVFDYIAEKTVPQAVVHSEDFETNKGYLYAIKPTSSTTSFVITAAKNPTAAYTGSTVTPEYLCYQVKLSSDLTRATELVRETRPVPAPPTVPFVQPILTSDGQVGGDEFATRASSELDAPRQAWCAFDGVKTNNGKAGCWHSTSGLSQFIEWYNPVPLTITQLDVYNRTIDEGLVQAVTGYTITVSDDEIDWTTVMTGTNDVIESEGHWTITLPEAATGKYWRLEATSSTGDYAVIGEIEITGTVPGDTE